MNKDKLSFFNQYSLAVIKTPKCGTESLRSYLKKNLKDQKPVNASYDGILTINERKYDISYDHINYCETYVRHLSKIMNNDLKFITCIREPLERSMSHYYYLKNFSRDKAREPYEVWYLNAQHEELVSPIEKSHRTAIFSNNFMSHYLGFHSIKELTEDSLRERFLLTIILESIDLGYQKLNKLLNIKGDPLHLNKTGGGRPAPSEELKKVFKGNNKLDYKLYELCTKIWGT